MNDTTESLSMTLDECQEEERLSYQCSSDKIVHWTREDAGGHVTSLVDDGYEDAYVYECIHSRIIYDDDGDMQFVDPLPHFHVASSHLSRSTRRRLASIG